MDQRHKIRYRFRKAGGIRWVSHLDLTRCFERMLRRADLPFRSSGGFHPLPRIVFALPLPLGAVGCAEVVELEFTEPVSIDGTLSALNAHSPEGLSFLSAHEVPAKATPQPRRIVYRFPVAEDRRSGVAGRAEALLSERERWVERQRPKPRRVNVRAFIRGLTVAEGSLVMDLWVTNSGSTRPDELLTLLGLSDRPAAGDVLEREWVELHDESDAVDGPVIDGPTSIPIRRDVWTPTKQEARSEWGVSPSGPVVE